MSKLRQTSDGPRLSLLLANLALVPSPANERCVLFRHRRKSATQLMYIPQKNTLLFIVCRFLLRNCISQQHQHRKYAAIWRKVVGKSARDNPERYWGWFWVLCSSKKFERMAGEALDVCLRMLKESDHRRFNSHSVRNSVLIISHITFQDCRVHIFSDNLSRNSCTLLANT